MHRTYELGRTVFGIRTNSRAFGTWMEDVLSEYELADEYAGPYYSIFVAEEARGIGKGFHLLYKETEAIIRTLDLTMVGRVLLSELEGFTYADREDAVYVEAALVSGNEVAVLIPSELVSFFDQLGRRVDEAGVTLPVSQFVAIDPESANAVPLQATLGIEEDVVADLAELAAPTGSSTRVVVERPSPIEAVCTMGFDHDEPVTSLSRAQALYDLAAQSRNLAAVGRRGLDGLIRLVEAAPCYELLADRPQPMLDAVQSVLARTSSARA